MPVKQLYTPRATAVWAAQADPGQEAVERAQAMWCSGCAARHDGAWLAGKDGAKAGMIMSGAPRPGMKYYQEIAPGVAMDRAEIIRTDEVCDTPVGTFKGCMRVKEGTALNPFEVEYKFYVPNIGIIGDEDLRLTKYGFVK